MGSDLAALPDDIAALKTALAIERARVHEVVAERDARAAVVYEEWRKTAPPPGERPLSVRQAEAGRDVRNGSDPPIADLDRAAMGAAHSSVASYFWTVPFWTS